MTRKSEQLDKPEFEHIILHEKRPAGAGLFSYLSWRNKPIPRRRAVRHSDKMVLNGPFSAELHKKFPKCVSIPGILLFVNRKSYHFKTALHL